jgi:hypothetical protein
MAIETLDGNIVIDQGIPRPKKRSYGYGVKYFEGEPTPASPLALDRISSLSPEYLRDSRGLWRPDETHRAAQLFFSQGKIIIEGTPKSGKGTLLFGISDMCDVTGWGYYFIDGHFVEAPSQLVVEKIDEASARKLCLFYDSFDYLFAGNSSMRKISKSAQVERTGQIIDALQRNESYVALTQHDIDWRYLFLDTDFMDYMTAEMDLPIYNVPVEVQSNEAISHLLETHDVKPEDARYFANMGQDDFLLDQFTNLTGDQDRVQRAIEAIRKYPNIRKLVRFYNGDFRSALAHSRRADPNAAKELYRMIMEVEHERVFLSILRRRH